MWDISSSTVCWDKRFYWSSKADWFICRICKLENTQAFSHYWKLASIFKVYKKQISQWDRLSHEMYSWNGMLGRHAQVLPSRCLLRDQHTCTRRKGKKEGLSLEETNKQIQKSFLIKILNPSARNYKCKLNESPNWDVNYE